MPSPAPRLERRARRHPRVVPAARWQRAAGWLLDVTPFVAVAVAAVVAIEGPDFVTGVLRSLVGEQGGTGLPSISQVLRSGTPEHAHLGRLAVLVGIFCVLGGLWVLYRVVALARYGRTVGKWLVGAAVVRVDDPSRRPSYRQSWARFLVPQASGWIPLPGTGLLPYLALCLHPRRRGIHDKAAGTIVVRARRPHVFRAAGARSRRDSAGPAPALPSRREPERVSVQWSERAGQRRRP
jgi:uncharacterized RDD family membrane protein YckC